MNLLLKTMDVVATKEYNNRKPGFLMNICYFQNTYPSSIYNLVLYWAGKHILSGVDSIQWGINLQWIPTIYHP